VHRTKSTYGIETAGRASNAGVPGAGGDLRARLVLGEEETSSLSGRTYHRKKIRYEKKDPHIGVIGRDDDPLPWTTWRG
jgi:hypothetical protein